MHVAMSTSIPQMFPSILKSAVQSTNTIIFVPSSFDFIRVQNHLRKMSDVSLAILSECVIPYEKNDLHRICSPRYSSNQDISRARQSFFSGKRRFLLMSERFHFFRRQVHSSRSRCLSGGILVLIRFRYRIRGVRNIVFYGLPEHPQFYTELLSYPFLDDGVDASDITCCALYCKYDYMRLERTTGSEAAGSLLMQAS
jgi:U3 small nucleolar RNA-associated protein 25